MINPASRWRKIGDYQGEGMNLPPKKQANKQLHHSAMKIFAHNHKKYCHCPGNAFIHLTFGEGVFLPYSKKCYLVHPLKIQFNLA